MDGRTSASRWAVALSGGGHRAALYSAGALLYLVDSGVNREVGSVVSVSGGTLTNGMLAQASTPFSQMDRQDFLGAVGPLLNRCAYKGTVVWAREIVAWGLTTAAALIVAVGLFVGSLSGPFRTRLGVSPGHPWWYFSGAVVIAVVFAVLVAARCRVADLVFRRLLYSRDGAAVKLQCSPQGCPESPVRHIFCASELQSNLHAYFSPRFIYNFDFGVSTSFDLPLSTAVQASSNFPPVFPARRLRARALGLAPHEGAQSLWLSDGGVYDNMAEEWVTGAFDRSPGQKKPVPPELTGEPPERLLVVNSSQRDPFKKAASWLRVPLLGEAGVLLRLTALMHQVTTTNRRARLVAEFTARRRLRELDVPPSPLADRLEQAIGIPGALTHIGTPADWVAQKYPGLSSGQFGVINAAFAALSAEERRWMADSHAAALALGTGLAKTGEATAAGLLWQGYVLTMVYLYLDDASLPFVLPSRHDMVEVLRDARG